MCSLIERRTERLIPLGEQMRTGTGRHLIQILLPTLTYLVHELLQGQVRRTLVVVWVESIAVEVCTHTGRNHFHHLDVGIFQLSSQGKRVRV